jgi:hypothetical protein
VTLCLSEPPLSSLWHSMQPKSWTLTHSTPIFVQHTLTQKIDQMLVTFGKIYHLLCSSGAYDIIQLVACALASWLPNDVTIMSFGGVLVQLSLNLLPSLISSIFWLHYWIQFKIYLHLPYHQLQPESSLPCFQSTFHILLWVYYSTHPAPSPTTPSSHQLVAHIH